MQSKILSRALIALFMSTCITGYADEKAPDSSINENGQPKAYSQEPSPYPLYKDTTFNPYPKVKDGVKTTTHMKCIYRTNKEPENPSSMYAMAIDKSGTKNYVLHGYWHSNSAITNMFYTDTSHKELMDICAGTLKRMHIESDIILPYAADNGFSYQYTIWSSEQAEDQDKNIERMVIFGDSLSDVGNVYNATYFHAPNINTWFNGHFTNGRVWHEYLGRDLGIVTYNWAVGGATGDGNLILPGIREQIRSFLAYTNNVKGYDINKTAFSILFGGNDFINENREPVDVVNDIYDGALQLIRNGAKNIIFIDLPDISVAPVVNAHGNKDVIYAKTVEFNKQLKQMIEALKKNYGDKVSIFIFPINKTFDDILKNPENYGITNINEPCLNGKAGSISIMNRYYAKNACKEAKVNYVFWDDIHPTTKVHEIIAKSLLTPYKSVINNPEKK